MGVRGKGNCWPGFVFKQLRLDGGFIAEVVEIEGERINSWI